MQQIVSHPQSYCVTRMASCSATSEREQAQKSGTETEEYKNVKQNMEKIKRAIDANPPALGALTRQFMTQEWLDAQLDSKGITSMKLIQLALNRIENDSSQHNQFIKMLKNITGLDHILSSLYVKKEEMVSGKTDRSPTLLHSPKVKKKVTQLEPDSGYAAENTPPCPRSHPPGTIPNPLVEVLEKRLEEEIEAKNALQQERDELENTLEQYQEYATKEKGVAEEKIKEKEQELKKCKENMSVMKTDHRKEVARVEREKKEMELEHKHTVVKLEEEIASLKKERDDKDQKTEVEMLRLENRLCKAEKQIIEKDYLILEQQMTILKLNKKITDESKDTEIHKLKRENMQLRKGKSLRHSLSDLKIDEEDS